MSITVVVPHFNQEDYLRECLERLRAQQNCGARVEIIVVDNGSQQMPDAVCAAFPGVRLMREATPGPGPARNTGAAAAEGDVLAFIDADCNADAGWLSAIEEHFKNPSTQIIGGDVRVGYADPTRPTFLEPYEAIYSYRNEKHIAEGFSGTGNLAMRPEILQHVGPFADISTAEDRDWGLRANALGYRIDYLPSMIVYHPARKTFGELTRKWDRHIAHDYRERAISARGKAAWLARTIAMAGSPIIEILEILTSRRVAGWKERGMAFACLCAVRLYRSQAMLRILICGSVGAAGAWRS